MSGTSWNSVGEKHEEQRSSEGSGMLAIGGMEEFPEESRDCCSLCTDGGEQSKAGTGRVVSLRRSKR